MSAKRDADGRLEVDLSALAFTPAEAAAALRIGVNQLYVLIHTGGVPAVRWGGRNLIVPRRALEEYVNELARAQQQERIEAQLPARPVLKPVTRVPAISRRGRRQTNV